MKTIALVNCTATKTRVPEAGLQAASLPKVSLSSLADEWYRRGRRAGERVPAGQLYSGRTFTTTLQSTAEYGVEVQVVSAGFGVVDPKRSIPSYSLTVTADSADCILTRVSGSKAITASDWWNALTAHKGVTNIASLIEQESTALIVLALTSVYLTMITKELVALPEKALSRVRIVGPKRLDRLPEVLRPLVMPYDNRLNGPDSKSRGTEFDFAHRALLSFIRLIHEDTSIQSAAAHARRVRLSLKHARAPVKATRERITDEALRERIRLLKWKISSASEGLRTLRERYKIACEQSRFARLWACQQ